MQGLIPISIDDRQFTTWDKLIWQMVFLLATFYCGWCIGCTLAANWSGVWAGDFTGTNVVFAVGETAFVFLALGAFYGAICLILVGEPMWNRGSVLLDTQANQLFLKARHITGFTFRKSLSLDDVRDVSVTWDKNEDGSQAPKLILIPTRNRIQPLITNPADLPVLATRLCAVLYSAGWRAECGMWMSTR
jgi:hypothetical protein